MECICSEGAVLFSVWGEESVFLLEGKKVWQDFWDTGLWDVSMFLLSLGVTMFSWAFLAATSTMAGTQGLFPAEPVGFLPSHMQEKRNQKAGWYDKIKSDFLTA